MPGLGTLNALPRLLQNAEVPLPYEIGQLIAQYAADTWRPCEIEVPCTQSLNHFHWPVDHGLAQRRHIITGRRGRFHDAVVFVMGHVDNDDVVLVEDDGSALVMRPKWGYLQ